MTIDYRLDRRKEEYERRLEVEMQMSRWRESHWGEMAGRANVHI